MITNRIRIKRFDSKSLSAYFRFNWKYYYADLADIKYVWKEFMVFECNQRWVVDYSWVYQDYFDEVSKKNFLKWIKSFKKRIVKHN